MNGITGSTALWYASRATGVVSLLLLTAVVLLGVLVNRQGRLPGLPRFVVTGLHRSISLLSVAFVAVHVITAIADLQRREANRIRCPGLIIRTRFTHIGFAVRQTDHCHLGGP